MIKCDSCGKDIENTGKENEWCMDCQKRNPQAYFYRKGGHAAD